MNHQEQFKARAMESINALRETATVKELALELYEMYELGSPVQSWISRVGACFNPQKPEFFNWCDVVALMMLTGNYEPLYFVCDELGLSHPDPVDSTAEAERLAFKAKQLRSQLAEIEKQLEKHAVKGVGAARFLRG